MKSITLARPIPELTNKDLRKFLVRINFGNKCWYWKGGKKEKGYGEFFVQRDYYLAHRVSYEIFRKEKIPLDMVIDHLCKNKSCVIPSHLEVVTAKENCFRGTFGSAINSKKTHCIRDHEFTKGNTYYTKIGYRGCRLCRTKYMRLYCRERRKRIRELKILKK